MCKADSEGTAKLAKVEEKHKREEVEASTRCQEEKSKLESISSEIRFEIISLQVKCRFGCSLLGRCWSYQLILFHCLVV